MSRTIILAALMMGQAFAQTTPNPVGDWQGTLKVGNAELRLVLHIAKNADGKLSGTIDSIDQPGSNGIPVTSISMKESKLALTADSIHGAYEGALNSDGTSIHGTWTQGQPMPLDFQRAALTKADNKESKSSDIDGAWTGNIDTGAVKLRIVFHITGLTATMDSPDQNVKGVPVTSVVRSGATLTLELKQIAGKFEGKINTGKTAIDGTWTQGPGSMQLVLTRLKDASQLERRRPQNPTAPYPYNSEDVAYLNPIGNIQLAATLTTPKLSSPAPAVVLITGSGPQDRDESLLGHKPFLVLSDYLTRRGVAVLRVDDRGVARSGGTFATSTTADFATDVEAGVAYLKTRGEINPHKIGLVGHSEGAIIAPMVAARNPSVAFIVMMAGSGVVGEEILIAQTQLISEASGASHEAAEKNASDERKVLEIVRQEPDLDALKKKLAGLIPEAPMDAAIQPLTSPWFRYFLSYDPALALQKVKCPVLAIGGSKDLQVPPKQNLAAIRKALEAGGNKTIEVEELPGLNHLFQTAKTGAPSEYAEIEETIAPVALEKITRWILNQ